MAILKVLLFVLVSSLGYTSCAFVDTLTKCALKDKECQKTVIQKFIKEYSVTGVEELNMPGIDPLKLKEVDASIDKVIDIFLIEGTVTGAKDCIVDKFNIDMDKLRVHVQLTCDITVKGKYKVKSSGDVLKNLFEGKELHGEGNGKCKIEQITIKIEFPFKVKKRGDDFYVTSDLKKYKYSFKIHKKVTFYADSIYLGNQESSKVMLPLLNENWSLLVESFGGHFMDISVRFLYPFLSNFLDKIPAKYYISDDLSSYAE